MDITPTPLAETQAALQAIVKILSDVKTDDDNAWYEVGRALGTARHALIMTGAKVQA